tara:strand:+ start:1268 stop:1465 length:198 start_codon:yes stop_codon:yes gene_type:complete
MKDKEKFECADCGCFYWVNDRDEFECPNCDNLQLEKDIKNNLYGEENFDEEHNSSLMFGVDNQQN